jgi:beta-glucanase (GH16 family)
MEYYGRDDAAFHSTEHVWVAGKDARRLGETVEVPAGQLTRQFNEFGVLITPELTTFYFNRRAYWSTPTPPEYRQPFYILADLAIGGGWPYNRLTSPKIMDIAYIHVYSLPS